MEEKRNGKFETFDKMLGSINHSLPNPAEIFMTPGTDQAPDIETLIFKSYIDDRHEAIAVMAFYGRCVDLKCQKGIDYLHVFLASKAAIKGAARAIGLQAVTNAIAPEVLQNLSGGAGGSNKPNIFGKVKNFATRNNEPDYTQR